MNPDPKAWAGLPNGLRFLPKEETEEELPPYTPPEPQHPHHEGEHIAPVRSAPKATPVKFGKGKGAGKLAGPGKAGGKAGARSAKAWAKSSKGKKATA